jgi:GNAT superfamily N-acetyltransferase
VIETQPKASLRLRAGRIEDAEMCGSICYEAFKAIADQHNFPPDFPSAEVAQGLISALLSRGDVYSVVAEVDGRIVGSNFLWENGVIAGVGPITIDPAAQNAAVGRRLMEAVLPRRSETSRGCDWCRPPITTARYRSTPNSGSTRASLSRTSRDQPSGREYPGMTLARRP